MSKTCKKCGGEDFTPAGNCKACKRAQNEAYRLKRAGGGSAVKTRTKVKDSKPAQVSMDAPATLEISGGYGLRAHIDTPYLFIAQDDGDGNTDTVCLSRAELRQLIEKFGSWATA